MNRFKCVVGNFIKILSFEKKNKIGEFNLKLSFWIHLFIGLRDQPFNYNNITLRETMFTSQKNEIPSKVLSNNRNCVKN